MPFSSGHMQEKNHHDLPVFDVNLVHLAEVVLTKFPLFHTFLSGEKSLCKPHTGGVAGHDPSHLGWNSYINHLQFYCTDLFVLPHGFTYISIGITVFIL